MKSFPKLLIIWGALALSGAGTWDTSTGSVFGDSSPHAFSAEVVGIRIVEGAQQAARMVRYVVLESGQGVRWEPSEALIRRLEVALDRPWKELKPLSAPFARADTPIVTTEGLAGTILAEIAYARHLKAQDSPEALVYLYLASRQVGFAQEELLDPGAGLYRPRWRDGEAYGDPELDDQLRMLWALSEYSTTGALLSSDVARSETLFRRQTGPLADRLYRAIEPLLQNALMSTNATRSTPPTLKQKQRIRWATGLQAYAQAKLAYAREAERLHNALLSSALSTSEIVSAGEQISSRGELTLTELAERVFLLGTLEEALEGALTPPRERRGEALEELLAEPAVQSLLSPIPWPSEVVYDPAVGVWRPAETSLDAEAAMALAYGLLAAAPWEAPTEGSSSLRSPGEQGKGKEEESEEKPARRTLEGLAQDLEEAHKQLKTLKARLERVLASANSDSTTGPFKPTAPSGPSGTTAGEMSPSQALGKEQEAWSPWDVLLVGSALLLGVGTVLQAWRRHRS